MKEKLGKRSSSIINIAASVLTTLSMTSLQTEAQNGDWITNVKSSLPKEDIDHQLSNLLRKGLEPGNHLAVDPQKVWTPSKLDGFSQMCAENSSRRYKEICDTPSVIERKGPAFNIENLRILYNINLLVNGLMTRQDDDPFYDFHNPGPDIGDCEEYVYAKLLILSGVKLHGKLAEIGVPMKLFHPSFLRPTLVYQLIKNKDGVIKKLGHMVLSSYMYDEVTDKFVTIILDNLRTDIYLPSMGKHIEIVSVAYPGSGNFLAVKLSE